jgi:hypothetical protein
VEARANADALFAGLGARFGPTQSAPRYEEIRAQLGRSAMIPSRLFNDTSVWTRTEGNTRWLQYLGVPRPSTYILGVRDTTPPFAPGEYRRSTRLRWLTEDQYDWMIRDELAIGSVRAADLGAALEAMFRVAAAADSTSLRAAYRQALPRTTSSLGRLFTLDSIGLAPARDGGTLVSLRTTLQPRRIAAAFPNLARFLERYLGPMDFEMIVADPQGLPWWTARFQRNRFEVDFRVVGGQLAPLQGAARAMPDRLRAEIDISTKIGIFGVGITELVSEVSVVREANSAGFEARFTREPDWHLPPLVERLIRTPLRRPFQGEGAFLALGVRTSGGRTLLVRDYEVTVQESAIVRWFGGLGNTAFSDFRGNVERESDRFNGEVLQALRQDALALLP